MRRWLLLVILLWSAEAFAGGLVPLIAPPAGPLRGGEPVDLFLYLHHHGGEPLTAVLPARLVFRVEGDGGTREVTAPAADGAGEQRRPLSAGGFARRAYRFHVPEGLTGPLRLGVPEWSAGAVLLVEAPAVRPAEAAASLDALMSLHQPYLLNFSAYEPMYFLVGTDPEKSKFQISFKYRFLNPRGELVGEHPWLSGLHLGYTQTSYWNLRADSAPFEDTSYKPELFFVSPNAPFRPAGVKGLFLQTGLQHESNGRGGTDSRSTNFFYVKPVLILHDADTGWGLALSPRIWAYLGNDGKTNPDLADYRGYFELGVKLGKENGLVLDSRFRWAAAGASTQLDLTYPLRQPWFAHLDLFLHVQYVNALAESLLRYRERSEALRLGFSIVR